MSADNRKVSTDALETLGTIITEAEKRDAIHLAVVPVKATMKVWPGQHVDAAGKPAHATAVGIVDPFLTDAVQIGQWFWLVIYPRKITSLRHVWSHPSFPEELVRTPIEPPITEAEQWIRQHADAIGLSYGALMDLADEWLRDGEIYTQMGSEHMRDTFDDQTFWSKWEIATGKQVPDDKRHSFFSCSC